MSQQQQPLMDLANVYRELYRSQVRASVAADTAAPFVLPWHFLTYFVVPTVYLAIPHRESPWLYRARWLVLTFVVGFNWAMIGSTVSLNFASAYGIGLLAAWGVVWNFTLLVWKRPQWDAKRVVRRRKVRRDGQQQQYAVASASSGTTGSNLGKNHDEANMHNSVRRRGAVLDSRRSRDADIIAEGIMATEEDRYLMREILAVNQRDGNPPLEQEALFRLCKATREQKYEYYWQEYPADASFWTRLSWSFDLVCSIRMTGWSWAPSCLPPYEPPPKIGDYQLPLEYGVHRTRQGFERTVSRTSFVFSRLLFHLVPSYVVVDLCAVLMTADPYFVVGPEQNYPLPAHLSSLHPALLFAHRTLLGLAGILSALHLYWNWGALLLAVCGPPLRLGFRAHHPWLMPSMTGSLAYVMDHGLAGFWGTWWHQTFRVGFAAPGKWLYRRRRHRTGYLHTPSAEVEGEKEKILPNGKNDSVTENEHQNQTENRNRSPSKLSIALGQLVAAAPAFAQSGFIHGSGSYGTPWPTRPWNPPLFFLLSYVGTATQATLSHLVFGPLSSDISEGKSEKTSEGGITSRRRHHLLVRRTANLAFAAIWLAATSWLLVEDFSRAGLWLFEPVPVSIFRAAGYGDARDPRVWRWDRDSLPGWYAGRRWWEMGLAI